MDVSLRALWAVPCHDPGEEKARRQREESRQKHRGKWGLRQRAFLGLAIGDVRHPTFARREPAGPYNSPSLGSESPRGGLCYWQPRVSFQISQRGPVTLTIRGIGPGAHFPRSSRIQDIHLAIA